jgi:hypothetical protein
MFAGGIRKPVIPSSTTSGRPPTRVATTGMLQAAASTAATPKVSESSTESIAKTSND